MITKAIRLWAESLVGAYCFCMYVFRNTRRIGVQTGIVVTTALIASSCSLIPGKDVAESFSVAVGEGDYAGAAELTNEPELALSYFEALEAGVGELSLNIDIEGDSDFRETVVEWSLPSGDSATTTGQIGTDLVSGKVEWTPSILSSLFTNETRVIYSDDRDYSTQLVDRNSRPIMKWTSVTAVRAGADNVGDAHEIAEALDPIIPGYGPEDVESAIQSNPDGDTTLVRLRKEDAQIVMPELRLIDGLDFVEEGDLLSGSRNLQTPIDAGLREYWLDKTNETAGWTLRAVEPNGGENILAQKEPQKVQNIQTTLDIAVQGAAQRAVDQQKNPASLVVISPSNGGIVAVAQNKAASEQGAVSLMGLYPPGSTFKTVTTAAALDRGLSPDALVECPATAEIDGRVIPNDNEFDLGTVTMTTAFAASCNTTQGFISREFEPTSMKNTALSLGLGIDFTTPGLTTVTGSVPETEAGAARVEAAIGQGEVLASPFGLAVMEASLANGGKVINPQVIFGEESALDQNPEPLSPRTVEAIRAMMYEAVATGSARSLNDIEGLGGKTGTAEIDGQEAYGWFAGIVDDYAFSSLVERAGSSDPALEVAGAFLRDETIL